MKYGNTYFLQLSREIFTEKYSHLSIGAKWLFVVLNELEQRYTGKDNDFFFRTDKELAKDAEISLSTLKRYKSELRESNLVEMWNAHFKYENGKLSTDKVSCYRILK